MGHTAPFVTGASRRLPAVAATSGGVRGAAAIAGPIARGISVGVASVFINLHADHLADLLANFVSKPGLRLDEQPAPTPSYTVGAKDKALDDTWGVVYDNADVYFINPLPPRPFDRANARSSPPRLPTCYKFPTGVPPAEGVASHATEAHRQPHLRRCHLGHSRPDGPSARCTSIHARWRWQTHR